MEDLYSSGGMDGMARRVGLRVGERVVRGAMVLALALLPLLLCSKARAQTTMGRCEIPVTGGIAWGACSGTQNAGVLSPGQTITIQNTAAGYIGSLTRICALDGSLTAIAAPCVARTSVVPTLPSLPGGDWTLGFVGQSKTVTLTVNSTGGCTLVQTYLGSAVVNRDGSITLTVPPYSGFGSCTAPRPYLQNPTSCTLSSPSYGQSVFTFAPGFVVTSVPAENGRGGGCR
jgi:hypothetical protein